MRRFAILAVLLFSRVAFAGIPQICGRLATQTIMTCVPPGDGPALLWDALQQSWQPSAASAAPVVLMWAEPNIWLPELANDPAVLARYRKLVDEVRDFLKTKDKESRLASEKPQGRLLDLILEEQRRTRDRQRPRH